MASAEQSRKHRRAHPERTRAATRKWRLAHPEQMANARRNWQLENPKYQREWQLAHPKQRQEYVQKYRRKYPEKASAHQAVSRAIRKGQLKKPKRCSRCGKIRSLHGHHPDYRKKLKVIWVCDPCHKVIHDSS